MLFLLAALVLGTVACVVVTGGSLQFGYPIEVAIARGLVAFIGLSIVGYLAELVVATAPPPARAETSRAGVLRREVREPVPLPIAQNETEEDVEDADMRRAA